MIEISSRIKKKNNWMIPSVWQNFYKKHNDNQVPNDKERPDSTCLLSSIPFRGKTYKTELSSNLLIHGMINA